MISNLSTKARTVFHRFPGNVTRVFPSGHTKHALPVCSSGSTSGPLLVALWIAVGPPLTLLTCANLVELEKMLQNHPSAAKTGFDTAENEPSQV